LNDLDPLIRRVLPYLQTIGMLCTFFRWQFDNGRNNMSWFRGRNKRNQEDEMMRFIDILKWAPGADTDDAVNGLRAYGTACLVPLIRETKDMKYPGSVSGIRDSVFMTMRAADALSILENLISEPDPDIELVAAIAISMFDYEGRDDLKRRGMGFMRYVQNRAKFRGDNFAKERIDELIKEID
jgi:hypothetical protein